MLPVYTVYISVWAQPFLYSHLMQKARMYKYFPSICARNLLLRVMAVSFTPSLKKTTYYLLFRLQAACRDVRYLNACCLALPSHTTSVNEEGFKALCDSDVKHQYVSRDTRNLGLPKSLVAVLADSVHKSVLCLVTQRHKTS